MHIGCKLCGLLSIKDLIKQKKEYNSNGQMPDCQKTSVKWNFLPKIGKTILFAGMVCTVE
jgi:hypothetical protein